MNALVFDSVKSDEGLMACVLTPADPSLRKSANGHTPSSRWAKKFNMGLPTRVLGEVTRESAGYCQRAQLETLLLDVLAEIGDSLVQEAERGMELALKRICEFFGLEWAAVWRKSTEEPSHLVPVSSFPGLISRTEGLPRGANGATPSGAETGAALNSWKTLYPWTTAEVQRGRLVIFPQVDSLPAEAEQDKAGLRSLGVRSGIIIPLCAEREVVGALSFGMSTAEMGWPEVLVKRLQGVAGIFAQVAARKVCEERLRAKEAQLKLADGKIQQLTGELEAKDTLVEPELEPVHAHPKIVGRSRGIIYVLRQAEQVAPADCSVLITGATGTGKELIAQEIHQLSPRKARAMVLVNCAALPSELVESELFGRERGAYTGALTSQAGRFELADGSTIFLDEVGELPLGAQAKLLRVLQQGEFQRLGSPKTHKVDVRVIAATNRDLAEAVRQGKFREDLYYRLRVFPIDLPSLSARAEDIPLLVFAFLEEFATGMGKKITKVAAKDMGMLQRHSWPGNIRELRNVIEHSVIVTAGDTLRLTLLSESPVRDTPSPTLAGVERDHILKTLESTNWRVKGPYGAAARLDLQPSTLYSRMQKLGIPHRRQKDSITTES